MDLLIAVPRKTVIPAKAGIKSFQAPGLKIAGQAPQVRRDVTKKDIKDKLYLLPRNTQNTRKGF
jgi:hypothetical protein